MLVSDSQALFNKFLNDVRSELYLQALFNKFDNDELLELLANNTSDALSVTAICRVLKDRLEGLDDVVRVQLLSNKVVGA